jgi:hypothetical protein
LNVFREPTIELPQPFYLSSGRIILSTEEPVYLLVSDAEALRALLAECKPYVEYEREARERELMFAGGIASVISRASHERDACDALLDRIDAAVQR